MVAGTVAAGTAGAKPIGARYVSVRSPNGRAGLTIGLDAGRPTWAVDYDRKPVLLPSGLGLWLADGRLLGASVSLVSTSRSRHTGLWQPKFGAASSCDESHDELTLRLFDSAADRHFDLVARAYDSGVALRYRMADAPVRLMGERTQFRFAADARLYASRDEGEYQICRPSELAPEPWPPLTGSSDPMGLADVPVTVDVGNGLYAQLGESDRLHYPRLMLKAQADALVTCLMRFPARATGWGGPGDTPAEPEFDMAAGQATPWRVLLLADSATTLIEQAGLIPTLATPGLIVDESWIRPGRAIRIRAPYSTQGGLDVVDFAASHRLEYVEYDAHWYGDGTDASDALTPLPDLDLQRIIDYARARGIGMILYVDRVAATRQLADICRTYSAWGVAGIKFGFVWEGRCSDNDFIFDLLKTCADYKLLVNLHDNLRPAGLERTLANYVALEGVRGNEQFPPARHNVTLAFTRMLAGPLDYTICYANEKNQTTNAHQLAMAAVYYNPLTFLYWYDTPAKYAEAPFPELAWFDRCPTTWDETRALSGVIGEHVVIARRKGREWFLGALANEASHRITIGLDFLGDGAWTAQIFRDGDITHPLYLTPVVIEAKDVGRATRLTLELAASGGQAILFSPKDI